MLKVFAQNLSLRKAEVKVVKIKKYYLKTSEFLFGSSKEIFVTVPVHDKQPYMKVFNNKKKSSNQNRMTEARYRYNQKQLAVVTNPLQNLISNIKRAQNTLSINSGQPISTVKES